MRPGERKRKAFAVEAIEIVAHLVEHQPLELGVTRACIFEYVELQHKQFVVFQPELRPLQSIDACRLMDIHKSLVQRHKPVAAHQHLGQRVGKTLHHIGAEQVVDELLHGALTECAVAKRLGEVIHSAHTRSHLLRVVHVNLRMSYAVNAFK